MSALFLIVQRSLRQHALSTVITALSIALGCGLVLSVITIKDQAHKAFTGGQSGFDGVLGGRGSELQIVLNSVFHLEAAPGTISWAMYQGIKKHPVVKYAVPYAVGDNYLGFRIVGTTEDLFNVYDNEGQKLEVQPGGQIFDPTRKQAMIGSYAAQKTNLKLGDTFKPYHGFNFDPNSQHEDVYHIVGILKPTNTPIDRAIFIPLEGFFRMGGHTVKTADMKSEYVPKPDEEIPDSEKTVSYVMLKFKEDTEPAVEKLKYTINRQGKEGTLVAPISDVLSGFFDKIGWIDKILGLIALLVVFVAAGAILASIYNSMNERRREIAILRALGARRATVFSAIVFEAAAIAGCGAIISFAVHFAIMGGAAWLIREQTGIVLDPFAASMLEFGTVHFRGQLYMLQLPYFVVVPVGVTLLGGLVGIVPAIKAYGTDVASNLAPAS